MKYELSLPFPKGSVLQYKESQLQGSLRFMTNVNINATEAGLAPAFSMVCCVLQKTILQGVNRSFLKNKIP